MCVCVCTDHFIEQIVYKKKFMSLYSFALYYIDIVQCTYMCMCVLYNTTYVCT